MNDETTRRTFLATTGAAVAVGLAGCTGDDDGDDGGDGDVEIEIDAGTTVELEGYATHWEGVAPGSIDGEENPTLILEEGGEYTFEWVNGDGVVHDLEIHDDGGDVVDDLETEDIDEEGEGDSLTFEASSEMTTYICSFHTAQQVGDLVVE